MSLVTLVVQIVFSFEELTMISVGQARRLISKNTPRLSPTTQSLPEALGLVLAKNVSSPSDYPLYDVSAMDGYALKAAETRKASPAHPVAFRVQGTQHAGNFLKARLKPGVSFRVMTGGVVPAGADCVLERELVSEKDGIALLSHPVARGRNIRYRGEGIKRGGKVMKAGTFLHSRSIGFLASLGVDKVQVHPRPKVALVVTGNELVNPGKKPKPGQIYNSNQWMLETALKEWGISPVLSSLVPDQPQRLKAQLKKALTTCDLVLLVGGVSVGDSDFSKPVLESLGVKRIFWRVAQKPGFPLYFGKKGKALVFGLPGNPASAWVNFYEYVLPCLRKLQGLPVENSHRTAKLVSEGPNRGFKTLFLKARFKDGAAPQVVLLKGQGSHLLQSLAEGNSLAVVPTGKGRLKKGERLEVHPLSEWNGL